MGGNVFLARVLAKQRELTVVGDVRAYEGG